MSLLTMAVKTVELDEQQARYSSCDLTELYIDTFHFVFLISHSYSSALSLSSCQINIINVVKVHYFYRWKIELNERM